MELLGVSQRMAHGLSNLRPASALVDATTSAELPPFVLHLSSGSAGVRGFIGAAWQKLSDHVPSGPRTGSGDEISRAGTL